MILMKRKNIRNQREVPNRAQPRVKHRCWIISEEILPSLPKWERWILSLAGNQKLKEYPRYSPAVKRTTRSWSANPVWVRPRSWRDWHCGSCSAKFPGYCLIKELFPLISLPWWPEQNTADSLRKEWKRSWMNWKKTVMWSFSLMSCIPSLVQEVPADRWMPVISSSLLWQGVNYNVSALLRLMNTGCILRKMAPSTAGSRKWWLIRPVWMIRSWYWIISNPSTKNTIT